MQEALTQLAIQMSLPALVLVTARVAGIFLVAPVLGSDLVPLRLRLFIALVVGLGVVGRVPAPALSGQALEFLGVIGCELLIGATLGYAARLLFAGVELGAFHVGQQMGVSLAEVFDPFWQEEGGVRQRFFQLLAIVIFLAVGGHREVLSALLRTFDMVPPLGAVPGQAVLNVVVALLTASFTLAIKVAAPVLIALMLALVAMGLLQRTLPQFNMFSMGLSVQAMLGLLVLAGTLAVTAPLVQGAWDFTAGQLMKMTQALR
jgi:flagellar biosynthetic protein FliR